MTKMTEFEGIKFGFDISNYKDMLKYRDLYYDNSSDWVLGLIMVKSWKQVKQVDLAKRLGITRFTAKRLLAGNISKYQQRKLADYVRKRKDYALIKALFNALYTNYCNKLFLKEVENVNYGKEVERNE